MARVERDVGRAALEDGEQADEQLRGAGETEPDRRATGDAGGCDLGREAVGVRVQLRVTERGVDGDDGSCVRCPCGLRLERTMDRDGGIWRRLAGAQCDGVRARLALEQGQLVSDRGRVGGRGGEHRRQPVTHLAEAGGAGQLGRGPQAASAVAPRQPEAGAGHRRAQRQDA